eukprot:GHVH01006303.1.p1 GENE.GHVH01006303.1~~GHVH01006303.1.p1  ORF type:complete len:488 (-),score=70.10 GHVH01006303.1:68-1531(-)
MDNNGDMRDCEASKDVDGLDMVGLRPGWNDEGFFFHPHSHKEATGPDQAGGSAHDYLLNLARISLNSINISDVDTKLAVVAGFRFYESFGLRELMRMERNFAALPHYDASLLPFDVDGYIKDVKDALRVNQALLKDISQEFFDMLVETACELSGEEGVAPEDDEWENTASMIEEKLVDMVYEMNQEQFVVSMTSARSTIKQFMRDWSSLGRSERDAAYSPLLVALEHHLPDRIDSEGVRRRVLCPGTGLARLPYEVLRRGYCVQGNEYAHSVLIASDWILNHMIVKDSMELFPFVMQNNNRRSRDLTFQKALIPDVSPCDDFAELVKSKFPDMCPPSEGEIFSMSEGEFVESYDEEENTWDAVLCSFFIDTAQNIIQYIKTIARITKPGGYFISNGPLLYHYAESDNKPSIELSYEDIRSIILNWFDIVEEKECDACYTSNGQSLMWTQYKTKFFVAKRRSDVENPPRCTATIFNSISNDGCQGTNK